MTEVRTSAEAEARRRWPLDGFSWDADAQRAAFAAGAEWAAEIYPSTDGERTVVDCPKCGQVSDHWDEGDAERAAIAHVHVRVHSEDIA